MTLKSDAKFKEKLTCGFKYDMKDLVNFPKYVRFELKKYRGVIFHDTEQWCKNWIRALKSLKNCTLIGSFCPKNIIFQLKISEELCVITLKVDANFKGKLTCGLKNNTRNLVNFHASSRKSENLYFDQILLSKGYKILVKKYRRVMFPGTKEWCKVKKEKLIFGSKNDMSNLVNFHPTTQKSGNFTSVGYFCPNYMRFELKNTEELSFMTLMQNGIINWVNCH